jgi:hypothetical protein
VLDFTDSSVLDVATAQLSSTIISITYQHIPTVVCCLPRGPTTATSVPNSTGDASSHRFISPEVYSVTVFLTADTTLNLISPSAVTSHHSDLLVTFLAHYIVLFSIVAPSSEPPWMTERP